MTQAELAAAAHAHGCVLQPTDRDYIPTGKRCSYTEMMASEPAPVPEYSRCGRHVSDDIQSGPIYCGEWAKYAAVNDTGMFTWCERHVPDKFKVSVF